MKVLPEPSVKMGVETEIIVPADVYDKGYADGKKAGISEGIEQGADVEKKRWWGIFTDNGTRTAWTYGFAGWPADCIDPLFDVTPINATAMFTNITASGDKKLNIPEIEARNNIKFDFSKTTHFGNFIAWGAVEDLGFMDLRSAVQANATFANSSHLKKVSIAIKEDGSQNFSGAFDYTTVLEDFTVVSGVFGSNLNFQWTPKLNKASVTSIVEHLSDNTSGLSVTFSKEILNQKQFDWNSGTTTPVWSSGEWEALIATKPYWSFKLV